MEELTTVQLLSKSTLPHLWTRFFITVSTRATWNQSTTFQTISLISSFILRLFISLRLPNAYFLQIFLAKLCMNVPAIHATSTIHSTSISLSSYFTSSPDNEAFHCVIFFSHLLISAFCVLSVDKYPQSIPSRKSEEELGPMLLYISIFNMPLYRKTRDVDINYSRHSQNLICVKLLIACNFSLLVLCPNVWSLQLFRKDC